MLYPYFGYCEQCCDKHSSVDIFLISYFHFLLNIHSEVELLDHMVASLIVFFDAQTFLLFDEAQFIYVFPLFACVIGVIPVKSLPFKIFLDI